MDTTKFTKQKRTVSLYHEDGSIPIMLSPPPKSAMDLYPVLIGNSSGELKGPAYHEWQEKDPEGTTRAIFQGPLDALEIYRTGRSDGALLLKKGAYESGVIDHSWRYGVYETDGSAAPEASMELPRQKTPKAIKARAYAPGFNLTEMVERRQTRNQNILPERLYEDFCDDDYDDEAVPVVTPFKIARSLRSAIRGDTDDLDTLIAQLSASQLGVSEVPLIRQFTARRLGFLEE